MSLILDLFRRAPAAASPSPVDDYWYTPVGGANASGVDVSPDAALRCSAVFACVKVISETVAMLPVHVYRRMPGGGKERLPGHVAQLALNRPNPHQTRFEWLELLCGHLEMRGNAYSELVVTPGGRIELWPRHPDRVKPKRDSAGNIYYKILDTTDMSRVVAGSMMLHVRLLSLDGLVGMSPLEYAAESIGKSLAADRFGGKFFGNAARPSGILKHPGTLSPEAAKHLRESWQTAHGGANVGGVAVLEEGMDFQPITLTAEEAQFIQTLQHGVEDIARFFRMPLHKIGHLLRSTFSNIEHQAIEFVTDTIAPTCSRIEQSLTRALVPEAEQGEVFVEFLLEGLLRGDAQSRFAAYQSALTSGWLTRNEVRARENLNPLPGLDEPLAQLSMGPTRPEQGAAPSPQEEEEES